MRTIDTIVVHCAATPPGMNIGADEIRQGHLDRGWSDIGYHYVIRRDGEIEQGRDLDVAGAHAKGHNAKSIGICLVGGKDSHRSDGPTLHYTDRQLVALDNLIAALMLVFGGSLKLLGHNDLTDAKACPGFNVRLWWSQQHPV